MKQIILTFQRLIPSLVIGVLIILSTSHHALAQLTPVVRHNGSSSLTDAPQGAAKNQRQFYLIPQAEVALSDITTGDTITSIGFNQAIQQNVITGGKFLVYLENTSDNTSRYDQRWTDTVVQSESLVLTSILPGVYEWQVSSVCADTSPYAEISVFSNATLTGCYRPDSLWVEAVTESSASLAWNALNTPDYFLVEYKKHNEDNWLTDTAFSETLDLTGLDQNTTYLWKVKSSCSGLHSPQSGSSFVTKPIISCNSTDGLSVQSVSDTSAILTWNSDAEADRYEVQYRRAGAVEWITSTSFVDSVRLTNNIFPGTQYEWQLRIVCNSYEDYGEFIPGTNFTTTGTTACYPPVNPTASHLTDSTATLSWMPVPGVDEYVVRYRLRESIAWDSAIATMIKVHDDSIYIPALRGQYHVPFSDPDTFIYSGEGLYVAWEYTNESGALSLPNTSLCHKQDTLLLSFSAAVDAASSEHKDLLQRSNKRPATWMGSSALRDSVAIENVFSLGRNDPIHGDTSDIIVTLTNHCAQARDIPVTITVLDRVTGETRHTSTQNINLASCTRQQVLFDNYTSDAQSQDSIIASTPAMTGENIVSNNEAYVLARTHDHWVAFSDQSEPLVEGGAGFGAGSGLILCKYYMQGCGKVIGLQVHIDPGAIGEEVYGVVRNFDGSRLDSTSRVTIDSSNAGDYVAFYFEDPVDFSDESYYVGLAQISSGNEYHPVGTQYEGVEPRNEAYYYAAMNGTGLTEATDVHRLMITAEISHDGPYPFITGESVLCESGESTLGVGSSEFRYAYEILSFSSEWSGNYFSADKVLGTPDFALDLSNGSTIWFSHTADGQREHLIAAFPDPAPINHVSVVEAMNPGAVDSIFVKNPGTGDWMLVYSDSARALEQLQRKLDVNFEETAFNVSEVKITLGSDSVPGFNAIDAVVIGRILDTASFTTYSWSTGETTDEITVTNPGDFSVTVEHGGCYSSAALNVVIPDSVAPEILFSGSSTLCRGETLTLRSSETGGNTWSTGETTDSIVVDSGGTYSLMHDNGCFVLPADPVVVTVNELPVIPIGDGTICAGDTIILDGGAGASEYEWSTGDTMQTIEVHNTGYFSVTVTDVNACVSDTAVITTVRQLPTPQIVGDAGLCPGEVTLLSTSQTYSEYLWTTMGTGPTATVSTSGIIGIEVTDAYGCTGTDEILVVDYIPPEPFISGTLSICVGNSTQLDAGGDFAAYAWSTGETSQTIVVDTALTWYVTVTDFNGCTGSADATTVQDGAVPESPGPISGPMTGICGSAGVQYSIDPVPNTEFYVWTVPEGVSIVDGSDSTVVTVDFGPEFTEGDIVVAASNACGQSPSIDPTYIAVTGIPGMPGAISGPVEGLCDQGNIPYSIEPVPHATEYTWTVPSGAVVSSGQGTNEVTITFAGKSGDVCVIAESDCGIGPAQCMWVEMPEPEVRIVKTTSDGGSGSLRQIIDDACWCDTVFFESNLSGTTIGLTTGQISIGKHLNIRGLGKNEITISGGGLSRIFQIESGITVFLADASLTNGFAVTNGGAIYNLGTLKLDNVRFSGNYEDAEPRAVTSEGHVVVSNGMVELLQ